MDENMAEKMKMTATIATDQPIADFNRMRNSCLKTFASILHLLVVMHEDLFERRLLNDHVVNRLLRDLAHDDVDIALEQEAHQPVAMFQVG